MDNYRFFSQFDLDFSRYRPMWYGVEIDVGVALNGVGEGSITLNNQPFLMYRITHAIIGATYDWQTSGLMQDDQYSIAFRDEQSNYQNMPAMSALLYGSAREGRYNDFSIPLAYSGNKTLHFQIVNRVARTLNPQSDVFRIGLCVHGVADWGPLQTNVVR